MAAAASAALDYTFPRRSAVHAMTRHAAQVLEAEGYELALPVQTNMIVLDLEVVDLPHAAFVEYCKEDEVAVFPKGRLVFHHQTWEEWVLRLLKALRRLMSDKKAGVNLVDHKVIKGLGDMREDQRWEVCIPFLKTNAKSSHRTSTRNCLSH